MDALIKASDTTPKIQEDLAKVFYLGWNTINYDEQKEISRNFISELVKDEYLKYLKTPGLAIIDVISTLSPVERV